jgi:hypothetical protein
MMIQSKGEKPTFAKKMTKNRDAAKKSVQKLNNFRQKTQKVIFFCTIKNFSYIPLWSKKRNSV